MKTKKAEYRKSRELTEPPDLMHFDVVGHMKVESCGGAIYFVTACNESSSLSLVRFLKGKSEVPHSIIEMVRELERRPEGNVK